MSGRVIDLNADLGEYADEAGAALEREVLAHVTSCNIACGGHTGDDASMRATLIAAQEAGVACGAHPSFPDREGFGRRRREGLDDAMLAGSLSDQIKALCAVAEEVGVALSHVKPHGALYNQMADDRALADLVAGVVKRLDASLTLVGLPGSAVRPAAEAAGLTFRGEAFVDRLYTYEGRLLPRGEPGAVVERDDARIEQALALAIGKPVTAASGGKIMIDAQTLCLHGDSPGAVHSARAIREALERAGVRVEAGGAS